MKKRLTIVVAAFTTFALAACDDEPTGPPAAAPFPSFSQSFTDDVVPWSDGDEAGSTGWCGTIAHVDSEDADPQPSAGPGYATVAFGACNQFWTDVFAELFPDAPAFSGPASGPDLELMSTTWPASGFVQQLDVHLDPADYADGLAFIYTNSLCILTTVGADPGRCDPLVPTEGDAESPFRYFPIFAAKGNGAIVLLDSPAPDATPLAVVTEAGWYTFRHVFGSEDDGTLTVDFELGQDGSLLGSASVQNTFITEEATADFDVADLGSGYIWFPLISGPPLPIDEQRLEPRG